MLSHQISDTLAKKFLDLSIYLPIYKRARSKFSKTHFINKIAIIISENALRKKKKLSTQNIFGSPKKWETVISLEKYNL